MKIIYLSIVTLLMFSILNNCIAQISFLDKTNLLDASLNYSGVAMGVLDINGDGLDDILRLNQGTQLNVEFQTATGFQNMEFGDVSGDSQWSMCAADVNNDGISEVLSGGFGTISLAKINPVSGSFENEELEDSQQIFVQGSNFADINNDGFLDLFACHDNGVSFIWENDGNVNFSRQYWIDMSQDGDSGEAASGNYGSTWTDFDNDGDIDLYIAKCRQGVTNVNDPRRINQLYVNDGNGNFTEQARDFGLASEWQSWTADFGDVNNDGWLDCFLTNHDHNAQLLINDGTGNFEEIENVGINISGTPIQGIMRDFDNDGFLDIIVAGNSAQVFHNNGDLTFTELLNLFNSDGMESFALGDLDNDGYVDVYGGYANIYTSPSNINDKMWINNGGTNNFSAIRLQGVISNRGAIGARVELHGAWGKQIREVRAGESYGIANSATSYFGLGLADQIDSLVVIWPSGLRQTEIDVSINTQITILEGGCLAGSPTLETIGQLKFCPGDSLIINAQEGFDSYLWSNGSTAQSLVINESGNYSLVVMNEEGCTGFSQTINVVVDPQLSPEIQLVNEAFEICYDSETELIQIGNVDSANLFWNTGESGPSIYVNESGEYFVTASGLCNDFTSLPVTITVFEALDAPEAMGDDIELGEVATLTATGENLAWFETETSADVLKEGETYEIAGLTETTNFYVADRSGFGFSDNVGMEEHSGSLYSPNPDDNNSVVFNASEDFILDSVTVYTDLAGERTIVLRGSSFEELASQTVDLQEGKSTVYCGMEVKAGSFMRLSTDFLSNLNLTGNFGPRLQRSNENVNYPYVIDNVVELVGSDFSTDWYFYFYDWKISTGVLCEGERTEVGVFVDLVGTNDINEKAINVHPNPTSDFFSIDLPSDIQFPVSFDIYNVAGEKVMSKIEISNNERIDSKSLISGFYTIRLKTKEKNYISKFIKL
ncbi:MAG: hypothetical protein ACI86M_001493 [Saprospiraceae bacterium]|jgi:hypothetical protein